MATLEQLTGVSSKSTAALIAFLDRLAEVVDVTPWRFGRTPFRASDAFVEPMVSTRRRSEREAEREREAWRFGEQHSLQEEELLELYELQRSDFKFDEKRWSQVVRPERRLRLLIKGAPGGGKSCATRCTVAAIARNSAAKLRAGEALAEEVVIPFWVSAIELAKCDDCAVSTADALIRTVAEHPGLEDLSGAVKRSLRDSLRLGRALVVVDALDEMTNSDSAVAKSFRRRMGDIDGWLCACVITCRTVSWEEDEQRRNLVAWRKIEEVTLSPLDNRRQHRFAGMFFASQPVKASGLRRRLNRDTALRHHCATPLILVLCAALHKKGDLLESASPAALYSLLLGGLLRGSWRDDEALPAWTNDAVEIENLRDNLGALSWGLFKAAPAQNRFNLREWKSACREAERLAGAMDHRPTALLQDLLKLGLLVDGGCDGTGRQSWSFAHRTVLEYLAAEGIHLDRNGLSWLLDKQKRIDENPFWFHSDWLQMLTFLAGVIDGGDAARLIGAVDIAPLIGDGPGVADDLFSQALGLKCRFVGASQEAARETARGVAAAWMTGFDRMLELRWTGLRGHWIGYGRDLIGNKAALAVIVPFLLKRLAAAEGSFAQVIIVRVLGAMGVAEAVNPLVERLESEKNREVRMAIVDALGAIRAEEAADVLIRRLGSGRDEDLQRSIARALGAIGTEHAVAPLVERLRTEEDRGARWVIAEALGAIGAKQAIDPMMERLVVEQDRNVRMALAEALGAIGAEEIVIPLLEQLGSEDRSFHRIVGADGLGALRAKEGVGRLLERLATEEVRDVRLAVIRALGAIGAAEAIGPLVEGLGKEADSTLRGAIAIALGDIGAEEVVSFLLKCLRTEESEGARRLLSRALGEIGSGLALDPLLDYLFIEKASNVRKEVIRAVGTIGAKTKSAKSVSLLLECLGTEDDRNLKSALVRAIGTIGVEEAVAPLLERLGEERDRYLRESIVDALGEIGSEKSIPQLLTTLATEEAPSVRNGLLSALWKISRNNACLIPLVEMSHGLAGEG